VKDDRVYLRHIIECLDAIGQYVADGRDAFFDDRKTRKAALRELQELAESTQRLSVPIKARYPAIPWRAIAGFRNVLVHDYLGLSLGRIWEVVENDLPPLRAAVESMLREVGEDDGPA